MITEHLLKEAQGDTKKLNSCGCDANEHCTNTNTHIVIAKEHCAGTHCDHGGPPGQDGGKPAPEQERKRDDEEKHG